MSDYDVIETGGVPIKAWTRGVGVEEQARKQLENTARLPIVFHHVAAMPDVHYGIGATVGSVVPTERAIIPAAVGVDIGCFTGDTRVPLATGTSSTLAELAATANEVVVYACTPSGNVVFATATARKTRVAAELVEVTLDNGERARCTPDHEFMRRDGTYGRADTLEAGASLMPLYTDRDDDGHVLVQQSVVSVRPLVEREDVYCLTVPGHGNFALAAGVFVHNCGMMAVETTLPARQLPDSLARLRSKIETAVPHGRSGNGGRGDRGAWQKLPKPADHAWRELRVDYERLAERHPVIGRGNDANHLGTLGTGNHFIEVCIDERDRVWFMLHSGSRGVGNRIGTYFIELARKDMRRLVKDLPDVDLAYLNEGTRHFDDYVGAVEWAQRFALRNRELMMDAVLDAARKELPPFELGELAVNCHHNYVAREHHFGRDVFVTRKGAVRARLGDLGIIPGSMGARSYIVSGKGNPESFCSCSHGAGRAMSRGEAKRRFSVDDHVKATAGIECRKDEHVIDETPMAYKPIDKVMAAQAELVDVVHELRQVVCVKG